MSVFHRITMEPHPDRLDEIKITIVIPRTAIGAETDRSLRAWFGDQAGSPKKLLKLAEQVMADEETYRNLPHWSLNDVCEKCGRPNVPKEE